MSRTQTWLHEVDDSLLARFVMFGKGVPEALLAEAKEHKDVTFLAETASALPCTAAPLQKLWLWLQCAAHAWPNAEFVAKAEDDVWVDLPRVMHQLVASRAELRESYKRFQAYVVPSSLSAHQGSSRRDTVSSRPRVLWGQLETYHWDVARHRPIMFGVWSKRMGGCSERSVFMPNGSWYAGRGSPLEPTARNATVRGPFIFAKGAFYALSQRLVSELVGLLDVARAVEAAVNSARYAMDSDQERTWPWEDVFLGFVLSQYATSGAAGEQPLHAVHIGVPAFVDGTRQLRNGSELEEFWTTPSTLICKNL